MRYRLFFLICLFAVPGLHAQSPADAPNPSQERRFALWVDAGLGVLSSSDGRLLAASEVESGAVGLSFQLDHVVFSVQARGAVPESASTRSGFLTSDLETYARAEMTYTAGYALPLSLGKGGGRSQLVAATGLAVVHEQVRIYEGCFLLCGDAVDTRGATSLGVPISLTLQVPVFRAIGMSVTGYALAVPKAPSAGVSATLSLGRLY